MALSVVVRSEQHHLVGYNKHHHWTFLQCRLLRPTAAYSPPQQPPSPAFLVPERSFQAGFIVDNLMAGNSEFKMA